MNRVIQRTKGEGCHCSVALVHNHYTVLFCSFFCAPGFHPADTCVFCGGARGAYVFLNPAPVVETHPSGRTGLRARKCLLGIPIVTWHGAG